MSDLDDFISNKSLIYDNYIVREHEESDVSDASVFSWRKSIESETSFFSESSDHSSSVDLTLKVSVKDSFILMLGFLNKIKKYFDESPDSAAKSLNEELELLETVLINSAESFGYDTRPNGRVEEKKAKTTKQNTSSEQTQLVKMGGRTEIHSEKPNSAESFGCNVESTRLNEEKIEGKKAKSTKQNRKNTPLKQTRLAKMSGDAEIRSDPDKEPRRKSLRIRNLAKNDKNEDAAVEKTEQKRQSKKRKIAKNDKNEATAVEKRQTRKRKIEVAEEDRRVSKRVKHNISSDRLSCTVAKLKMVTDEIKKQALSPVKEVGRMRNSMESTTEDSGQSSGSPSNSGSAEKATELPHNISRRSRKKKLYSLESWLDTLSNMMP